MNTMGLHALVIPPEIVGFEEQKYPAASLLANGGPLLWRSRTGQQQCRSWRTGWCHPHPAFARFARLVEGRVFQQHKTQPLSKEGDGFVIVGHQQGQCTYML
jgi:hypothetical protein